MDFFFSVSKFPIDMFPVIGGIRCNHSVQIDVKRILTTDTHLTTNSISFYDLNINKYSGFARSSKQWARRCSSISIFFTACHSYAYASNYAKFPIFISIEASFHFPQYEYICMYTVIPKNIFWKIAFTYAHVREFLWILECEYSRMGFVALVPHIYVLIIPRLRHMRG